MEKSNILLIMVDEFRRDALGCAGHKFVQTPNLDTLAARGTRFTNAYTNCPICVPARAAFATGNYANKTGYWDNSIAWDGRIRSWSHVLQDASVKVETIGKLHYRSSDDPLGLDQSHIPMYIKDGVGSIKGAIRDPLPPLSKDAHLKDGFPAKAQIGLSSYNQYDLKVTELARNWIQTNGSMNSKPWVLFVSFLAPHYPLTVPKEFFELYDPNELELPVTDPKTTNYKLHPWAQVLNAYQPHSNNMTEEKTRLALSAYFGLCSFIDHQIGLVLKTLKEECLEDQTRIIFTSDHGENAGDRGMWGKSLLYEHSTGVPMIIAGPGIDQGNICETPVSLVDCRPSILEATGIRDEVPATALPGESLFQLAQQKRDPHRPVFSEYHAAYSPTGAYMLRSGNWKLNYYVDYPPELFHLSDDPLELVNEASNPKFEKILQELIKELRAFVDPEATDRRAKDDQNRRLSEFGGAAKVLANELGTAGYTEVPTSILDKL